MKETGISVISTNIGKFLDIPEERLLIPRFQRPYSWKNDNFEDLWNDIISLEDEEVHFIGTIIRYQGKNKKAYYIVDGQQRLTTISILLAAIRDARASLDLSPSVVENCIKPTDPYSEDRFYKIQHETGEDNFRKNYRSIIDAPDSPSRLDLPDLKDVKDNASTRLIEAHRFFTLKINEILNEAKSDDDKKKSIVDLYKKVRGLNIVDIQMNNIQAAYRVFMTLNARGLDLSQADLIKSHLLSMLDTEDKDNNDAYSDRWNGILRVLASGNTTPNIQIKEDDYFYNYLISKGISCGAKNIFEVYEKEVQDKKQAEDILKSLSEDVSTFRIVYEPTYNYESGVREQKQKRTHRNDAWIPPLAALRVFGVTQPRPLLFATLRRLFDVNDKPVKQNQVQKLFSMIEDFHFIFSKIESGRGSRISKLYIQQAGNVYKGSYLNKKNEGLQNVQNLLMARFNSILSDVTNRESFVKKFSEVLNYDKDRELVRYVLEKYQPEIKGNSGDHIEIEHIMPKSTERELLRQIEDDDSMTKEQKEEEAARISSILNSVGNLILVRSKTNKILRDSDFKTKQDILRKTPYAHAIPGEILEAESWTLEDIVHRTKKMAERGYDEIWSFNKYK